MSDSDVALLEDYVPKKSNHNRRKRKKNKRQGKESSASPRPSKRRKMEKESDDEKTQSENDNDNDNDEELNSTTIVDSYNNHSWAPIKIATDRKRSVQLALNELNHKFFNEMKSNLQQENVWSSSLISYQEIEVEPERSTSDTEDGNERMEATQKEKKELEEQVSMLQAQIKGFKRKEQKYKLLMQGLVTRIIKGASPQYHRVKMHKPFVNYSKKMHALQQAAFSEFSDSSEIHIEVIDDESTNNKDIPNELNVEEAIRRYIESNDKKDGRFGIDETSNDKEDGPLILLPILAPKSKTRKKKKKSKSKYKAIKSSKVIEEFEIGGMHRIKALYFTKGVRAKMKIPIGTCLGQYVGVYRTLEEYNKIFNNSRQLAFHNQYAFDMSITSNKNDEEKEIKCVIDGFDLESVMNKNCVISKINDCRLDITKKEKSEDDCKHQNVSFVFAKINGFPAIFVVSIADIDVGQELFGNYGPNFCDAYEEKKDVEMLRRYLATQINDGVLKDISFPDQWDLT